MRPRLFSPFALLYLLAFSQQALSQPTISQPSLSQAVALTPSLCEDGKLEKVEHGKNATNKAIFKCDCQCDEEKNSFFIKHHEGYHQVKASRLLVDGYHPNKAYRLCDGTQSERDLKGLVFAMKVPAKDSGTCFTVFAADIRRNRAPSFSPIGSVIGPASDPVSGQVKGTETTNAPTSSHVPTVSNVSLENYKTIQVVKKFVLHNSRTKQSFYIRRGSRGTLVHQRTNQAKQTEYLVNFRGISDVWRTADTIKLEPPATIDRQQQLLILNERRRRTPFINASTELQQSKDDIRLRNASPTAPPAAAPAATNTQSLDTIVVSKDTFRVKQYARITHNPQHGVYVGWVVKPKLANLPRSEKSLQALAIKASDFAYHIEVDGGCRKVRYTLHGDEKYFRYCAENKGAFSLADNGIYLAQYAPRRNWKIAFEKMIRCDYTAMMSNKENWLDQCTDVKDKYLSRFQTASTQWSESAPRTKPTFKPEDCESPTSEQIQRCLQHKLTTSPIKLQPLMSNHTLRGWSYPAPDNGPKKTENTGAACLSAEHIQYQRATTDEDKRYGMKTLNLYSTHHSDKKTPLYSFKLLDECEKCEPITTADIDFDGRQELLVRYGSASFQSARYAVFDVNCQSLSPHRLVPRVGNYRIIQNKQRLVSYGGNRNGMDTVVYCTGNKGLFPCYQSVWVAGDVRVAKEYDESGKVTYLGSKQDGYKVLFAIRGKATLYTSPNKASKQYLIYGDKVTLLDQHIDPTGQRWYFVNYQRQSDKLDLNMWLKAERVNTFQLTVAE